MPVLTIVITSQIDGKESTVTIGSPLSHEGYFTIKPGTHPIADTPASAGLMKEIEHIIGSHLDNATQVEITTTTGLKIIE